MRLLLVSDSHGSARNLELLLKRIEEMGKPDAILFAGDGVADMEWLAGVAPIHMVTGNRDPYTPGVPAEQLLTFGKADVYLTHGDRHRAKIALSMLAQDAGSRGAAACVYGHTHVQRADTMAGVLLVNPGALRSGAYATLDVGPSGELTPSFHRLEEG
ncbi:MAG TPA: YfcE family phosphodiesterase [Candidatus Limnocylindria bacterium]|nr:YfcE family phosphodiesterase [Candidatus Limnocylindria bacterium]